jgi:hypothetical protein
MAAAFGQTLATEPIANAVAGSRDDAQSQSGDALRRAVGGTFMEAWMLR